MNKDDLRQIFANPFNQSGFTALCSEIAGTTWESDNRDIPKTGGMFDDVQSARLLGRFTLGFDNFISVSIQLNKGESARVKQRDIAKKVLDDFKVDSGLFAFYQTESENWRFSFVHIAYERDKSGQAKPTPSDARRYSYYVGTDKNIRTATQQIFTLLGEKNTLSDIKDAFSVEPLNQEFYQQISQWYEMAVDKITVINPKTNQPEQQYTRQFLIRFLTRIIFCWFLREKGLIKAEIFNKTAIANFLNLDSDKSSYYKAILQNLFFATLNKQMRERQFRKNNSYGQHYNYTYAYRYKDFFNNDILAQQFIETYFDNIPFLNGGLFECLDKKTDGIMVRHDYFSDNPRQNTLIFPNDLLLSGDKALFNILNKYQFTIEESSPYDITVALDPELLGQIFESLLGTYNPETAETARKATGSFYTPRDIVQYMVKASLKQYFLSKDDISETEVDELFEQQQCPTNALKFITYIDQCKILDPACGSGAFPMGILQQLVSLLQILDPNNKYWKQQILQNIPDITVRQDTEQGFEKNNLNYGRKLHLIEKCIYGGDIQTIAIQISKLRFFISLLVEQKIDVNEKNLNIRPLPNLETKLVAADSLITINRPDNGMGDLFKDRFDEKQQQLKKIRETYFATKTPSTKNKLIEQDELIRNELKTLLQADGWDSDIEEITKWQPYNPNATAEWFDAELMFGITDGFDIVIGNPPYIQLQKNGGILGNKYKSQGYQSFAQMGDIYALFYEMGHINLSANGVLCYITSNKWMRAGYGKKLRKYFAENTQPHILIDMGPDVFASATVDTNILLFSKQNKGQDMNALKMPPDFTKQNIPMAEFVNDKFIPSPIPPAGDQWTILSAMEQHIKHRIESKGKPLKDWDISINYGIKTGYNPAFIIDTLTKDKILSNCTTETEKQKTAEIIRPIYRGKDIKKYHADWADLYLIWIPWHFPLHEDPKIKGNSKQAETAFKTQYPALYNHLLSHKDALSKRNKAETGIRYEWYALQRWGANYWNDFFKPKILYSEIVQSPQFYYDKNESFPEATTFMLAGENLKYLLAIFNSKPSHYFFKTFYAGAGLGNKGIRYKKEFFNNLYIPEIYQEYQDPIGYLTDYIAICYENKQLAMAQYFTELIDIAVLGIYFKNELQKVNAYITDGLGEFTPDTNDIKQIKSVYKELQKTPYITTAFMQYKTVSEVQIILK